MEVLSKGRIPGDRARKFLCKGGGAVLLAKRNEGTPLRDALGRGADALLFNCMECHHDNYIPVATWDNGQTDTINA